MDTVSQKVNGSESKTQELFNWPDNPAVQKLLEVVAAIIAEEYMQTVRKKPEAFKEIPAFAGMTEGAGMTAAFKPYYLGLFAID